MTDARRYRGPLPGPDFARQIANEILPPFMDALSGEISADKNLPLGIARYRGKIKSVNLGVRVSGKNDSDSPAIEADVKINGVSALSTKPKIAHVSGELSQQKTTYPEAADTGITDAVINQSANTFSAGDVLTWKVIYTGAASPTTKIADAFIIVEVEPLP